MLAANGKPNHPNKTDSSITSTWEELKAHDYTWKGDNLPNATRIKSDMAKLVRRIGRGILTTYGKSDSGALDISVETYLDVTLGYGYDGGVVKYKNDKVKDMIDDGLSVYAGGYKDGYSGGHAWVIDGYATLSQRIRLKYQGYKSNGNGRWIYQEWWGEEYNAGYGDFLVHCNFGWGGKSDGYYYSGLFDTNRRVDIEEGVDTSDEQSNSNYKDHLTIIKYKR